MNNPTISAKQLGALALPDACPRCHWIRLHCGHKLPWQIFPGIFSTIDAYTKRGVRAYVDEKGQLPECFRPFGRDGGLHPVPPMTRFSRMDPVSGITLRGVPDEILAHPDGRFSIIDYKTGRYTEGQDRLLPMYLIQLNAYAWIARDQGMHPVKTVGLIYFEPQAEPDGAIWPARLRTEGFALDFLGTPVRLDLDPEGLIPPLLQEARRLMNLPEPPDALPDCDDCRKLEEIQSLLD